MNIEQTVEKHFLLHSSSLEDTRRLLRDVKSRLPVAFVKVFALSTGIWVFLKLEKPVYVDDLRAVVGKARLEALNHEAFEKMLKEVKGIGVEVYVE